jgi:hypothetical protein
MIIYNHNVAAVMGNYLSNVINEDVGSIMRKLPTFGHKPRIGINKYINLLMAIMPQAIKILKSTAVVI